MRKGVRLAFAGALALATSGAGAQGAERNAGRALRVREVDSDSMLVAFGVDTASIRRALVTALRGAGRLAPNAADTVPALDISLRAMRTLTGGPRDPVAHIHIEVGRNLVETGRAREPVWAEFVVLNEYPTWREIAANVLRESVAATNRYLLSQVRRRP